LIINNAFAGAVSLLGEGKTIYRFSGKACGHLIAESVEPGIAGTGAGTAK
jgi:hypothetical protein